MLLLPRPLIALGLIYLPSAVCAEDSAAQRLIPWLLDEKEAFKGIAFADVIAVTSGRRIIPFDQRNADDLRLAEAIRRAMDDVLRAMNAPGSPAQSVGRINEASSHFEEAMKTALDAQPGLTCDFPRTATGNLQRSGYPDLRIVDEKTGRIAYLDPKLFERGSRESSFRTFYFEPKRETNKVNDDAHHFIVGIEHERQATGWNFSRWELIDLANFRVKLKAEFEGSNRDLYRADAVITGGTGAAQR